MKFLRSLLGDKWGRLAVAVTGAALVAVFVGSLLTTPQFRATLSVFVDPDAARVASSTSDPAAQQVLIDSFVSLATSDGTRSEISESTGVAKQDIENSTSVEKVGTSNAVQISFEGDDAEQASEIVRQTSRIAFSQYLQSSLDRVNATVAAANEQYDSSTSALNSYLQESGQASPEERYNAVQQRLIDVTAGTAAGEPAALEAELARLQPIVLRFRELLSAQSRAGEIQRQAQARALELQSSLDSTRSTADLGSVQLEEVSRVSNSARLAILAAIAVALLSAGLLTLAARFRTPARKSSSSGTELSSNKNGENRNTDAPRSASSLDAPTQQLRNRTSGPKGRTIE